MWNYSFLYQPVWLWCGTKNFIDVSPFTYLSGHSLLSYVLVYHEWFYLQSGYGKLIFEASDWCIKFKSITIFSIVVNTPWQRQTNLTRVESWGSIMDYDWLVLGQFYALIGLGRQLISNLTLLLLLMLATQESVQLFSCIISSVLLFLVTRVCHGILSPNPLTPLHRPATVLMSSLQLRPKNVKLASRQASF